MFPSEMVILMAIAAAKDLNEKLLTRPLDVISEYINYLCSSLIKRGYLRDNRPKGYNLTVKGADTLLDFLRKNKTKAKDTEKMLQQLGIDINQDIGKLEMGAIGGN